MHMIIARIIIVAFYLSMAYTASANKPYREGANNNKDELQTNKTNTSRIIQFQIIGDRNLFSIEEELFSSIQTNLTEVIKLVNNSIRTINENSFKNYKLFTNVHTIDFSGNELTILKSANLKGLHSVRNISLSYNKILSINSNSFDHCPLLEELYIDHNVLRKLTKNLFSAHIHLIKIDASFNKLDRLIGLEKIISPLKWLSLKSNLFTNTWNLPSMKQLTKLNLKDNNIFNINEFSFDKTGKLEILSLEGNQLPRLSQGVFVPLKNLHWLSLANNKLTTTPDYMFQANGHIKLLYLNNNNWVQIGANTFIGLTNNLLLLDLQENQLVRIDEHAFQSCESLEYLFLAGNQLKYIEKSIYGKLNSLVRVSFDGNPIICDCKLEWLKKREHNVIQAFLKVKVTNQTKNGLLNCKHNDNNSYTVISVLKSMKCKKDDLTMLSSVIIIVGSLSIMVWLTVILFYYFRDLTCLSNCANCLLGLNEDEPPNIYNQIDAGKDDHVGKKNMMEKLGGKARRSSLDPSNFVEELAMARFPINNIHKSESLKTKTETMHSDSSSCKERQYSCDRIVDKQTGKMVAEKLQAEKEIVNNVIYQDRLIRLSIPPSNQNKTNQYKEYNKPRKSDVQKNTYNTHNKTNAYKK